MDVEAEKDRRRNEWTVLEMMCIKVVKTRITADRAEGKMKTYCVSLT